MTTIITTFNPKLSKFESDRARGHFMRLGHELTGYYRTSSHSADYPVSVLVMTCQCEHAAANTN